MPIRTAAACTALCLAAAPAAALGPESYLGDVGLVAASYCPSGTLEANGQLLQIAQMATLFTVLGTRYGGDGMTSFALPNLQGKAPLDGMRYCVVVTGKMPPRS